MSKISTIIIASLSHSVMTLSLEPSIIPNNNFNTFFKKEQNPKQPMLALITEPDTLASKEKMNHALKQISKVQSAIDFLSIRLDDCTTIANYDTMLREFLSSIRKQDSIENPLKVIIHHDENNMKTILKYAKYANGIHIKERNIKEIPIIKHLLPGDWCIGTSLHSISSTDTLIDILRENENIAMDYLYVGTCFGKECYTITHYVFGVSKKFLFLMLK